MSYNMRRDVTIVVFSYPVTKWLLILLSLFVYICLKWPLNFSLHSPKKWHHSEGKGKGLNMGVLMKYLEAKEIIIIF